MKVIHIRERGGNELHEYKKAVRMAKEAIDTICDLTEEMEDEFSDRRVNYGERYSQRGDYSDRYTQRGGYYGREWDDDEMRERRYRDSRGRFM